jgi:hypothetical protein
VRVLGSLPHFRKKNRSAARLSRRRPDVRRSTSRGDPGISFLQKPFLPAELLAAARIVLGGSGQG